MQNSIIKLQSSNHDIESSYNPKYLQYQDILQNKIERIHFDTTYNTRKSDDVTTQTRQDSSGKSYTHGDNENPTTTTQHESRATLGESELRENGNPNNKGETSTTDNNASLHLHSIKHSNSGADIGGRTKLQSDTTNKDFRGDSGVSTEVFQGERKISNLQKSDNISTATTTNHDNVRNDTRDTTNARDSEVEMKARDSEGISSAQSSFKPSTPEPNSTTIIKEFGPNYAEFYHDGTNAVKKLMAEKQGQVAGAFYRKDLGDIDLVWGEVSRNAKNEIQGYGLSKILEKHAKDFEKFSGDTIETKIANGLNEIIEKGKVEKGVKRAFIKYDNFKGVIALDYKGDDSHKWIITIYDNTTALNPAYSHQTKHNTNTSSETRVSGNSKTDSTTKSLEMQDTAKEIAMYQKINADNQAKATPDDILNKIDSSDLTSVISHLDTNTAFTKLDYTKNHGNRQQTITDMDRMEFYQHLDKKEIEGLFNFALEKRLDKDMLNFNKGSVNHNDLEILKLEKVSTKLIDKMQEYGAKLYTSGRKGEYAKFSDEVMFKKFLNDWEC